MDQPQTNEEQDIWQKITEGYDKLGGLLQTREHTLLRDKRRQSNAQALCEANEAELKDYSRAVELCKACIDQQVDAKSHIEHIATALLNAVFQGVRANSNPIDASMDTYEFVLDPVEDGYGITTGLKPMIIKNGTKDDPKNFGGGVMNLTSFAIRLIYLLLNPTISQVLILDEPMVNLSPAAWRHVVMFLENLQRDVPIQIIAITHSGADFPHGYRITRNGDTSTASLLEAV